MVGYAPESQRKIQTRLVLCEAAGPQRAPGTNHTRRSKEERMRLLQKHPSVVQRGARTTGEVWYRSPVEGVESEALRRYRQTVC